MPRGLLDFNKVVLFGDSITQFAYNPFPTFNPKEVHFGFGSGMTEAYTRRMDVVHRGYAGYNSDHGRLLIDKLLPEEAEGEYTKPVLMTVFFGTNDAAATGPQHVPLERYLENMAYIVDRAHRYNVKVVLIGPGWHNQDRWYSVRPDGKAAGIYRTTHLNLEYSKALGALAAEKNVAFVDLWHQFEEYEQANGTDRYNDLLTDGIHFSGRGYQLMFAEVMRVIKESYPELHPEALPLRLPGWMDLTPESLQ